MALIKNFQTYLNEIMAQIDGINSVRIVTEEKQMSKFITEHTASKNVLLLGVMPNFGNNNPASADEYQDRAFSEIQLLKKTTYQDLPYDKFIDDYDEVFDLVQQVKAKLLEDHLGGTCNLMRFLDPTSFITEDVYNLSQCNGWKLVFSFDITP